MIKNRLTYAAALAVTMLALTTIPSAGSNSEATPTFSKDVAPILFKNCASCHRPGDIAPMSLLTYENARPWAKAIREQVAAGTMPPWHATQPHGTFSNDRRLSDKEKDTLIRWADAGAPKGDPKHLPTPPKFTDGWEIGTPDAVISIPKEFEVPESGTIAYQFFEAPTNFTEDKWVQAIEVRPGARSVVHHVLVFCREPGARRAPGFVQVVPNFGSFGHAPGETSSVRGRELPGSLIATTAPGTNAMIFKPGSALRIKAGATLAFQVHYTSNGTATRDRTSIGMVFAKQPPQQEMRNSAFVNPLFVIPPGAANQAVDSAIQFSEDSHIWALFPHTHLRGKSWEYRLVYPDGRSESVLSVPKYNFNWQTYYVFAKPLAAPKGSRLEATAHYDNSAANKWNPDPKLTVRWGPQTWEEMQYSGITYSIDEQSRASTGHGVRDEKK
ncbi:MAG TPA: thiol-disulfide isomerase [Blastocatellia bacterium]|nr:thiol-disulfide isomerase [Blastocatellia bacterium]